MNSPDRSDVTGPAHLLLPLHEVRSQYGKVTRRSASMEKKFKVIIVGGSIAGLSLAHCLDAIGIDYVVLERHKDIAPQVGASVGIMPNGARILDQLGLFDAVEREIEPLYRSYIWYPDGFGFTSAFPRILSDQCVPCPSADAAR